MSTLDEKKLSYAPAYVTGIYPLLVEEAKKHGYAISIHGSIQRDLDLVAIPWTEDAVDPECLIVSLCQIFDIKPNHPLNCPERKPHGRLSWSIPLWWGAYIDISVMPRIL
jgi:hypothetical protein